MISIGIDYSMTSPGVCVIENDTVWLYGLSSKKKYVNADIQINNYNIFITAYPEYNNDIERFIMLADWVCGILSFYRNKDVVIGIEGYSMGSRNGMAFTIGENTGVLKSELMRRFNLLPTTIPPTTVKKFATGKGNADKSIMRDAFVLDTSIVWADHFDIKNEDISPFSDMVDAYWISKYIRNNTNV